jgi:uncharacterized membrane protein
MADDKDFATAMIHLYRGELGRLTMYRVRLDTTTNWALGASAAIISFTLGHGEAPHFMFALSALLSAVFAWLESRRFQELVMIRRRVRHLEAGFFSKILSEEAEPEWRTKLRESLAEPALPITLAQALSVRVRRNYLWQIGITYAAWFLKLALSGEPLTEAAAVGTVPGAAVIAVSVIVFAPWFAVAFLYHEHEHERG